MSAKTKAARIFGRYARRLPYLRLILHGIGVPSTIMGLYFLAEQPVAIMGVPPLLFIVLCLLVSLGLQYAIASSEEVISNFLVWVRGSGGAEPVVYFFLSLVIFGGVGWAVHQISQEGRLKSVDTLIEDPTKAAPTLVNEARSLSFAQAEERYNEGKAIAAQVLKAAKKAAKQTPRVKIGPGDYRTVEGALAKANSVQATSPSWAAGIRQNVQKAKDRAKARENELVAAAQREYNETLAALLDTRTATEAKAEGQHTLDLNAHNAAEDARITTVTHVKSLVNSAGWWLVIFSTFGPLLVSICAQLYFKMAGVEPGGEIYDPTKNKSKAINQIRGWFDDQFEIIDNRFGQFRHQSKKKKMERGAYSFRWVNGFSNIILSVGTVVILIKCAPTVRAWFNGQEGVQQMGFFGDPVYWLGGLAIAWGFKLYQHRQTAEISVDLPFTSEKSEPAENSLPRGFQQEKSESGTEEVIGQEKKVSPESQQEVSRKSAPPPPDLAIPEKVSSAFWFDDDTIKYRKRVYNWWATAHNKKKPVATREANKKKALSAFDWFESQGCTVNIKNAGKVGIKFPKA